MFIHSFLFDVLKTGSEDFVDRKRTQGYFASSFEGNCVSAKATLKVRVGKVLRLTVPLNHATQCLHIVD